MVNSNKKQLKITKLFRKLGAQIPEDCEELQQEIRELEQHLKDKHDELFEVQRSALKRKGPLRTKTTPKKEPFIRPERIVLNNDIAHLDRSMDLMKMLTGTEVKSYVANDHCVVMYHMQHPAQYEVQHGLRINMKSGSNQVSKFSLPLGFNFNAVVEEFDNIMTPECLGAVRKGLVAYYDRQTQFEALKHLVSINGQLFKAMDASHVELSFRARAPDEPPLLAELQLDYRVYDVRPKSVAFSEIDLPEGVAEALKEQVAVFKRKPLAEAFREAFIDGDGTYKFVQLVGEERRGPRRRRPHPQPRYDRNNDDTFRTEDCESEDEDERDLRGVYGRGRV